MDSFATQNRSVQLWPVIMRALTATLAAVMWVATMAAGRRRRTYSVNFGYMRRAQMVPPPHRRRPVRV